MSGIHMEAIWNGTKSKEENHRAYNWAIRENPISHIALLSYLVACCILLLSRHVALLF